MSWAFLILFLFFLSWSWGTLLTEWTWASYRAQRTAGQLPVICWREQLVAFYTFTRTLPHRYQRLMLFQQLITLLRGFLGRRLTEQCGRPGQMTQQITSLHFWGTSLVHLGKRPSSMLSMLSHMHLMFTMLCWIWSAGPPELKWWTQIQSVFHDYLFCQSVKSAAAVFLQAFIYLGQVHWTQIVLFFRNTQPHTHHHLDTVQPYRNCSLVYLKLDNTSGTIEV